VLIKTKSHAKFVAKKSEKLRQSSAQFLDVEYYLGPLEHWQILATNNETMSINII